MSVRVSRLSASAVCIAVFLVSSGSSVLAQSEIYVRDSSIPIERNYFTTYYVDHAPVSESLSPVRKVTVTAEDGGVTASVLRMPPGEGPFPAIIMLHGGTDQRPLDGLWVTLMENPVYTRILAAGYVVVGATYRSYTKNIREDGAILDVIAMVDYLKTLSEVDNDSVVLFGGSAGGALSLAVASRIQITAIGLGEPATHLYGAYYTSHDRKDEKEMARPVRMGRGNRAYSIFSEEEMHERYVAKLKTMDCPILLLQGNIRMDVNGEINNRFKPALEAAKKKVSHKLYPGMKHGFYFGRHPETTPEVIEDVAQTVLTFFGEHIKVKPKPIILDHKG